MATTARAMAVQQAKSESDSTSYLGHRVILLNVLFDFKVGRRFAKRILQRPRCGWPRTGGGPRLERWVPTTTHAYTTSIKHSGVSSFLRANITKVLSSQTRPRQHARRRIHRPPAAGLLNSVCTQLQKLTCYPFLTMSCLWRPYLVLVALLWLTPGVICDASSKLAERHMNQTATVGKAVYLITNEQTNAVVALRVGPDGKLSHGTVTPTGGAGSVALNSQGEPAITDALVSQSALTVAGNVSLPTLMPP